MCEFPRAAISRSYDRFRRPDPEPLAHKETAVSYTCFRTYLPSPKWGKGDERERREPSQHEGMPHDSPGQPAHRVMRRFAQDDIISYGFHSQTSHLCGRNGASSAPHPGRHVHRPEDTCSGERARPAVSSTRVRLKSATGPSISLMSGLPRSHHAYLPQTEMISMIFRYSDGLLVGLQHLCRGFSHGRREALLSRTGRVRQECFGRTPPFKG